MKKIFFTFLFMAVTIVSAKDYALIVTIGHYKNVTFLQGAHQDNIVYREILKKWDVHNIISLKDSEATRKNILYHLSSIARKIQKNDRFYMFFSGHGSSLYDALYSIKFQLAGLTEELRDSGVILPYDFDPKEISQTILIGKRDLRPQLEKIDLKINSGLIVIDACYSEHTIRGDAADNIINRTPNILTQSNGYPYEHIVYIASSITEAQSGKFGAILSSCLKQKFVLKDLKRCINIKMDKSLQIPVVLSN